MIDPTVIALSCSVLTAGLICGVIYQLNKL
jgi:hypothetical protein